MGVTQNANRGLVSTLVHGAKDIPRNASWLAAKAVPHEHHTSLGAGSSGRKAASNGGNGSRGKDTDESNGSSNGMSPDLKSIAQRAGRAVRDVMPSTESSVESGLGRARQSAEEARQAEDRAVAAAEEAHALRERADAVAAEEVERLKEIDEQQRGEVDQRVATATKEAEDHISQVRREAEAEAERARAEEQEASQSRVERARAEADRAQEEAQQRLTEATERLAQARSQAEEAAALAQQAADRAKADAERISAQVRHDQAEADEAVSQAVGLRERTTKEAASVTRTVRRTARPVLAEMSKADLLHLAAEREIPGRSSMSKKQLTSALEKKQ